MLLEVSETREARDRGQFDSRSAYVTAAIEALEARAPRRAAPVAAPAGAAPLPCDAFATTEAVPADTMAPDLRPALVTPCPAPSASGSGPETPAAADPTDAASGAPVPANPAPRQDRESSGTSGAPTVAQDTGARRISRLFNDYIALRLQGYTRFRSIDTAVAGAGKTWERNSKGNALSTQKLMLDLIGDRDISAVSLVCNEKPFSGLRHAKRLVLMHIELDRRSVVSAKDLRCVCKNCSIGCPNINRGPGTEPRVQADERLKDISAVIVGLVNRDPEVFRENVGERA